MASKYKRRLKTLDDLRRFLADAINRFEDGSITDSHLRVITYAISNLQTICKDADFERRLAALEDANSGQY